jgi:hypothetical protein
MMVPLGCQTEEHDDTATRTSEVAATILLEQPGSLFAGVRRGIRREGYWLGLGGGDKGQTRQVCSTVYGRHISRWWLRLV